jgi:multiple sugar transport system substrate-binding protein
MSSSQDGPPGGLGPTLTRRSFLRSVLAGAAAVGVAGCSSDSVLSGLAVSRTPPGTVEYWDLFGGGDGVRMQEMLDVFRKEHPEVRLDHVTLQWGNPYYTKLSLATIGDLPPTVAVSHLTRMKTLVSSNLLQELKPEDLARHGMTPDKFNKRAWEAGLVDGKAYAVPLDTHPFVMFYNTEVAKKAGLLDAGGQLKPLDGEDAFVDAMQRAKQATGAYGGVIAINNDTATSWRVFQTLYSQLGGEVLADEGKRVVIDDDKALRVLRFLERWTKEGLFPSSVDYEGSIAMFPNGQSGFFFQGEWEISTFQTAKMPFDMTLFPNIYGGDRYVVQADSHTLVLPTQPTQDREQLDRSLLFIRSLLDQSPTWTAGGHVPSWLPFRDSEEFKKLKPQSNYASAADVAVYDPPGWYSGSGSNFEIATGSAVGGVMAGQLSPDEALDQMHNQLDNLASTASPI